MKLISFYSRYWLFCIVFAVILFPAVIKAQAGINSIGSFESDLPSYWTKGTEPAGATLSWASDQSRSLGKSLKITKGVTSDVAMWQSENMVDYWSNRLMPNVDVLLGAYVKTQGVNVNPATDDAKWYLAYDFYRKDGTLIGETKLPIDQSIATSSGWVADTNAVGATILPDTVYTLIIKFVGGKNATGTVWADDFDYVGRGGAWAGQTWNQSVGVPTGWLYWLPPNGGNDLKLNDGFENTRITTEAAHTGLSSLKFDLPFNRTPHDGFVGTRRFKLNDVKAGDVVRISVWIKAINLVPDSAAKYPGTWSVGLTPIFHSGLTNNASYDEIGAKDLVFAFPALTQFDWTEYYVDVTVPTGTNVNSMSVRVHPYSQFTGTIYFDDLTVEKLDLPQISGINSFESDLPSYWTKGTEPAGATLTWASDQSRSLGKSLKITKNVTSDVAMWQSENMVDFWSPRLLPNVDVLLGAYIKTQGININPATDDAKWYLAYDFYRKDGTLIGETKLPIDQSTANSTGWLADTNAVGATILPDTVYTLIIKFVGGKNATGTVWADDFIYVGRGGAWAGQTWNQSVGVPTGWLYWLPPNGGNDLKLSNGFENTRITNETSYTGLSSLKFDLPFNRVPHDGFVGTRRIPLNNLVAGDVVRISVWIKASNLVPDSAAKYPGTWSVGLTPIFHSGLTNNSTYDEIGAKDLVFAFPAVTQFDWTQYSVDVTVPTGTDVRSLSVRIHPYSQFTGTIYFDELSIVKLDVPQISGIGGFESNLPSYWTKGTEPAGATLTWASDQSRSMGKSLKIVKSVTSDVAMWQSENMVDFWSNRLMPNVDVLLGAYIKTQGININPATDDAKWYLAYDFYRKDGTLIGETKLPINQSIATSTGWVADTNAVGATILPDTVYTLIIKFVGGKNATGTVWADDFDYVGRGGAWAGQTWNQSVGVPTGWLYWLPPNGGNDLKLSNGFENTKITTEAAHTGLSSLKFDLPFNRIPHDGFVGTRRYSINMNGTSPSVVKGSHDITSLKNVKAGSVLRISVWVKASSLVPDSAAKYPGTWSVGLTPIFQSGLTNNATYDEIGAKDLVFKFPAVTAFDWTQYYVDVTVPSDPNVRSMSVRIHPYSQFTGTIYFDDLGIEVISTVTDVKNNNVIPVSYSLYQNYPNPFNPSTIISYAIPENSKVTLKIYDVLGQEVKTLINREQQAGVYNVTWKGDNNFGSKIASGIYIYRIEAGSGKFNQTKKMILLK